MGLIRAARGFESRYHRSMNDAFSAYGAYIARRPLLPILIGLVILGGLSFGLFRYSKEIDLEKLWVEHGSRVVEERKFFNSRFGGIPRQEAVAIVSKDDADAQIDLGHAMDALTFSVGPLFDQLTWNYDGQNLTQRDFCVRPLVPPSLRPGSTPFPVEGNWLSWGYQWISTCAMQQVFGDEIGASLSLPVGWGFTEFPCTKLSPMDCFKEGGDMDYPLPLRQLETPIPGTNVSFVDVVANQLSTNSSCVGALALNMTLSFQGLPSSTISQIVEGVVKTAGQFYLFGYRWRKSYKNLTTQEILDHFNQALAIGAQMDHDPANPQAKACVALKLPCCLTWFGLHSPLPASLGSVDYDASGKITKVGGIRWAQDNYHENHPLWSEFISQRLNRTFSNEQRKNLQRDWEQLMINELEPLRVGDSNTGFESKSTYADLQLEFNTWRSSQDIISDAAKTPVWQIILSVVLTSLYATLAFINIRDPVQSHTWVVLTGLSVVTLSVLAGFGLTAAIGIKFSPLAGSVVPFLALGLGIDDVFVLVNIMRNYLSDPRIQALGGGSAAPVVEMRLTVALAGPSVVLTTFSVLAAFFISSLNPMPISQWFCWQMGITATLHTLGMLLIFMPIMAIDARRTKAGVNDPHLWLIKGYRNKNVSPPEVKEEGIGETEIDFMDARLQENTGSTPISRAVAKYYAPLFESNLFKIAVVIFFAALLASMSYLGFKKVEHGLKLSDVTLTGSYQNTFARVTEDRFSSYAVWVVTREQVDLPTQQDRVLKIFDALQNLTTWAPAQPRILESSFYGNLYLFANSTLNISHPIAPPLFYPVEGSWSSSMLGVVSLSDVWCEHNETKEHLSCFETAGTNPNLRIGSSKSVLFAQNLGAETKPNLDMIRQTRKVVDDLNAEFGEDVAFMYGYPFLFFEQYLHSYHDLYLVVGLALVGVFVAVLIFQFSIIVSLLIVVTLLMVDLEVYGFIYILGAKLNSLSLVNLGIVVGMSAEFTYLARSFLVVEGTRNYRVGKALEWTFEPLLHGFGTQVVATFPLLFVKYHAFRLYYFAMFTMMGVLGFLNGFVLLPVLLSWFGPSTLSHITERSAQNDAYKSSTDGVEPNSPYAGSGQTPLVHTPNGTDKTES